MMLPYEETDAVTASKMVHASKDKPVTWGEIHTVIKNSEVDNTIRKKRGIKFIINPFSSWSEDWRVMHKDYTDNNKLIEQLVLLFHGDPQSRKVEAQNLSLAAKNRAEVLSQKSDFYPVGITVCVATFAVLALIPPASETWIKPAFFCCSALTTIIYAINRFKSRSQVSDLKQIANLLDLVEKRL